MTGLPVRFPADGEALHVEKTGNFGFEPVQILLADSLRQNDIIIEPLDQLREGEIMRRKLPHRRDRDAGGQAGIDPGHEGFQLHSGILDTDVREFAPALHAHRRRPGKGDPRMGMEPLGIDEEDPAQDHRPAEGRGELQVGEKPRRTQFREPEAEGPFRPPGASPAGEGGDDGPDGRVRGGDHRCTMPHRVPSVIADAAVAARSGPAVRRRFAFFGLFGLGKEKFPADAAIDPLPGEDLRTGTFPQIGSGVDPRPAERLLPEVETEAVAPAVEAAAEAEGRLDQIAGLLPPAGEDPFEEAHPGVMPFDADVPVLQAPA